MSYYETKRMSEADWTIPTTVTRKQKRGTGFRYSTKKALNRSRLLRETKRLESWSLEA